MHKDVVLGLKTKKGGQRAQDCGEQSLVFYVSASQRLTDKIVRPVID